uniref:DUF4326 domain-containing protein n=1 Tax=Craspedostauros australis TaxID=1486917 RepID=A0A7R9ZSY3_9STRA|mmetsp:Transcript_9314/g.25259  ORF Transcript_9314/g.25259 Transcript_9314/m.25259 type:complete len:181 (+) Transcript_9314:256-798(+)|eukprot:CAMPEP_0198116422 /NCGR_PEP_ID=MMETSP1442-20131203/12167_1 /TAXON_ID= /ORGANISM="Craspedostauros australis, Strain CCMP3328" /LENGTH=180 /DNA_ID=CAMNT_0043774229 /DNA_START=184 /DNA_END=726 /DNA_ORIENTATION=+
MPTTRSKRSAAVATVATAASSASPSKMDAGLAAVDTPAAAPPSRMAAPIVVTNKRSAAKKGRGKSRAANRKDAGIYIGRGSRFQQGSPLGNPFKMKVEADRDDVVDKYQCWLAEEMLDEDGAARSEILRIAELVMTSQRPIHLVCWCAPKRCHGDIIKQFVEKIVEEKENNADVNDGHDK